MQCYLTCLVDECILVGNQRCLLHCSCRTMQLLLFARLSYTTADMGHIASASDLRGALQPLERFCRGSLAVSIDGPPEGDQAKGLSGDRLTKSSSLENAEEGHDPKNASLVMRGMSFPFRGTTMTKRSTAGGSFWSSMFRTAKDGGSDVSFKNPSCWPQ